MKMKTIQIDARTHERLKKQATSKGRILGRYTSEIINRALDAEKKEAK